MFVLFAVQLKRRKKLRNPTFIGVHVRRTDYLSWIKTQFKGRRLQFKDRRLQFKGRRLQFKDRRLQFKGRRLPF